MTVVTVVGVWALAGPARRMETRSRRRAHILTMRMRLSERHWPSGTRCLNLPARRFVPGRLRCSLRSHLLTWSGGRGMIIEPVGAFADQSAANKAFESAQG